MKKIITTSLIILLTSISGFATEDKQNFNDELTTKSFELLATQADHITLTGDVAPDDDLKLIFEELGDFIADNIFTALIYGEDYQGPIKDFKAGCSQISDIPIAKCHLIIQYKPLGEKALKFQVQLDSNKQPVAIINNYVYLSRGD